MLLAAHLDKADVVKKLLADYDNAKNEGRARSSGDNATNVASSASSTSPTNDKHKEDTKSTNDREIDLNATDKHGRTALHYCAEFDMWDEAKFLLESGVDVNARDNGDYPPAYFAAKNRKYYATKLLLEKGATTDFTLPTLTSFEIVKLLEKTPNSGLCRPGSSRRRSVSIPRRYQGSFSIPRRWSSANG